MFNLSVSYTTVSLLSLCLFLRLIYTSRPLFHSADIGLGTTNVQGNLGIIQCRTVEGIGKGHKLTVQIGLSGKESLTFDAQISYQAPIVATYNGQGAVNANTFGSQSIVVRGANFGPSGTVVTRAIYGKIGEYEVEATNCTISLPHTEITCKAGAGAGIGHKMILTIGSQESTIPTIGYGEPTLLEKNSLCAVNDIDHGKDNGDGEIKCSCAKCPVGYLFLFSTSSIWQGQTF